MTTTTLRAGSAPARTGTTDRGPAASRARRKRLLHWIAVHSVAVAAALFFVLPFVFVFLTSVMSDDQAMSGELWPHEWNWSDRKSVV